MFVRMASLEVVRWLHRGGWVGHRKPTGFKNPALPTHPVVSPILSHLIHRWIFVGSGLATEVEGEI